MNFYAIVFDSSDAAKLARFWADALDHKVDDGASPDYARIGTSPPMTFFKVPEGKSAKNRVHLDLSCDNREAEAKRLIDLGATHLGDYDEDGAQWTTLADPEGNEFDVVQA